MKYIELNWNKIKIESQLSIDKDSELVYQVIKCIHKWNIIDWKQCQGLEVTLEECKIRLSNAKAKLVLLLLLLLFVILD